MSYDQLANRLATIADLKHARGLLDWDREVNMPVGGTSARADALATLQVLIHERETAEEIGDLVESARAAGPGPWEAANVEEIHRRWIRKRAVGPDLVAARSRATSSCQAAWLDARRTNNWNSVVGKLQVVLDLTREMANATGAALGCTPYDSLLQEWEPDLTRETTDRLFREIRRSVPAMIEVAITRQPSYRAPVGPFPVKRQRALAKEMMEVLGLDLVRSRIDKSAHPFTSGHPDDVRITTRYDRTDFRESLFATIHEVGHAVYEQQRPDRYRKQPVGESAGMAVHESQSLLFEKILARSDAFLEFAAPILRRHLRRRKTGAAEWEAENLGRLVRRVERSLIRTRADELTYPLHVILRYDLETALIDGALDAADLPDAWEERISQFFGLTTGGDHRVGCLQDIHHYLGLLGYFPTYTIGAVMAAQLFEAAKAALPGLEDAIRRGELRELLEWLREHVHARGRSVSGMKIIADATGSELGPDAYLRHLRARYGSAESSELRQVPPARKERTVAGIRVRQEDA